MYGKVLLTFSALVCVGIALYLPPDIKTCRWSESDFNGCLKDAIQDTLPKLQTEFSAFNLPSVEPLHIPSLTIGGGKGAVQVAQKYKNFNIYDVTKAKIDKIESNITLTSLDLIAKATLKEIRIEADYELNGQVLMVPITGNGTCTIVLKDVKAHLSSHSEVSDISFMNFLEMKDFKLELEPGSMTFDFRNLFGGKKILGDAMNKLLNVSWRIIWGDVRAGYQNAIADVLKSLGNVIFKQVPFSELFPL